MTALTRLVLGKKSDNSNVELELLQYLNEGS